LCGLGGWDTIHGERRLVPLAAALMTEMVHRGDHSWGHYVDGKVFKGLGPIYKGVQARSVRNVKTWMFHTRLASIGAISIKNAHPYIKGHVIGAHNGSIYNYEEMNKKYNRNCEVDSEQIFEHLNDNEDLGELRGYGAITYIDDRFDKCIFCGKFNGGQLSAARIYSGGKQFGVVWASTDDALEAALEVAGLEYSEVDIKPEYMYYIKEGNIWKFEVEREKNWQDKHVKIPIKYQKGKSNTYGTGWDRPAKFSQKDESTKLCSLWTSRPELFSGLKRKQVKGGADVWLDEKKHVFNLVGDCYFCSANSPQLPVTFIGGYLNRTLCKDCIVVSAVDEWFDKPSVEENSVVPV